MLIEHISKLDIVQIKPNKGTFNGDLDSAPIIVIGISDGIVDGVIVGCDGTSRIVAIDPDLVAPTGGKVIYQPVIMQFIVPEGGDNDC